jgi:hypothetical protein
VQRKKQEGKTNRSQELQYKKKQEGKTNRSQELNE